MRNCISDEGRSFEAVLQEKASNHSKLLWSKAMVVSVREKVSKKKTSGKNQGDEEIEPLLKCRKRKGETKTEGKSLTRDKFGGNLFTG